jgi:hypothetical protein
MNRTSFFARNSTWAIAFAVMLGMSFIVTLVVFAFPNSDKVEALCDDAVHQLLTTKDAVELRRSIFLVRWFNSGIRRRL